MPDRLILFGGSFNPVHFGHLINARSAAELLDADRVVLIPSLNPPHKRDVEMPPAEVRLEMLRLAVKDDPLFEASDAEIRRGGTSFTYDTVLHFRRERGDAIELVWLIGADTLPELATWHRTEDLVRLCRMVTLRRPGWEMPDLNALRRRVGEEVVNQLTVDIIRTPRIDISATDIRSRARQGKSLRYLVPDQVARFVHEQRLYR